MKVLNLIAILLVALFTYSVSSCKSKKPASEWQYSSEPRPSLISKDTTTVILRINFQRGCTESEQIQLIAKSEKSQMKITYSSLVFYIGQEFYITRDSFFSALSLFEKASTEHKGCGGYAGGTGVHIEKYFKGMITTFNYCQEYGADKGWNGIEYFFELMGRKLENYPFKNN